MATYHFYRRLIGRLIEEEIDLGTWFDPRTRPVVRRVLERVRRASNNPIRIWLGDSKTGCSWLDEYDVVGRVSRSMGPLRVPILIPLRGDQSGGGAILTDNVIRIASWPDLHDLYRHPKFHLPPMTIGDNPAAEARVEYPVSVLVKGEPYASFKNVVETAAWITFMVGENYVPS